ncbi:aminoacetone oxidase family FAD-binding enzyme [Ruminococcus sp. OA3]|uniref:aminoacetone oxidase family FAD-binding enzyme n=1 Tax=Ruminococcus sp. OA3 TaxID=2914164 RepID=UPI001F055328|nr:aminoacetone oxidase family FAD-binding enzyme [Ruminococcus sp. OA3]MCH1983323.1 aminoacetone oxidase family FAD-binding enzyme [Ruminococcus sp. OA3]
MQIIVIGGGAAGLMAAVTAARIGASVTVLEQNDTVGKKLLATGNGKCNLTNVKQEPAYYRGSEPLFAWNVISAFGLRETLKFFTGLGVYTRNKNGGLYPFSEQALAVRDILRMEAEHLHVKLKTREHVQNIKKAGLFQVTTQSYTYQADRVILAAGGAASNIPGSGMDGFHLAESLGHTIIKPLPALVGLRGTGNYFTKWAGVRFEASLSLYTNDTRILTERGEVQFTDYGISGIPVFQVSRFAARALDEGQRVLAVLDFMPDFTVEELLVFLENRQEQCPYKTISESLIGLFPQKLISLFCTEIKSLAELAEKLKEFPVIIREVHSMEQAQVTCGGVFTAEIDSSTMESKKIPGLYFAGEVVDVDGCCGGYNLQWAWSSGALAGRSSAAEAPS